MSLVHRIVQRLGLRSSWQALARNVVRQKLSAVRQHVEAGLVDMSRHEAAGYVRASATPMVRKYVDHFVTPRGGISSRQRAELIDTAVAMLVDKLVFSYATVPVVPTAERSVRSFGHAA